MRTTDVMLLVPREGKGRLNSREWLAAAHEQLDHKLPLFASSALLTEDLVLPDESSVDVERHFGKRYEDLDTLLWNFVGLLHTSQLASQGTDPNLPLAPWPGFKDVWVPVGNGLESSGRLGLASHSDGSIKKASCIVLLPGLIGDNHVLRTRDLACALRWQGYHALALELRSNGQTGIRFPEIHITWGVLESIDLLIVSEWLQENPQICSTGLIGYCWGANIGLLTAWADGRSPNHPSIPPNYSKLFTPYSAQRHFTAGILAFSPGLRFIPISSHR